MAIKFLLLLHFVIVGFQLAFLVLIYKAVTKCDRGILSDDANK